MTKRKFKDATEPLTFYVTEEIRDEATRLGLTGRQMMALAIMRSNHATAPVIVRGKSKSGGAKFINGRIELS